VREVPRAGCHLLATGVSPRQPPGRATTTTTPLDTAEQLLGFRLETFLAHLAVHAGVANAFDGGAIAAQVLAERADVDGAD
jgi:hypothetical protein